MSEEKEKGQEPKQEQQPDEAEKPGEVHPDYASAINAIADQLAVNQKHQDASESDKAFREKLTIGLLVATVALTLVTLIATEVNAWLQHRDATDALHAAYVAMDRQQRSTADALHRADIANSISRAAAKQNHIDNTTALAAANGTTAESERLTRQQLRLSGRQADALAGQVALQRENLNRTYRRRLFAEPIEATPLTVTDKNVTGGMVFYFRNYGTFPAEDVTERAELMPVHTAGTIQNRLCRQARDDQTAFLKQNVAQGFPPTFGVILQNDPQPVHFSVTGTSPLARLKSISDPELDGPVLVACIAYRGADDKKVHYTRIMYSFFEFNGKNFPPPASRTKSQRKESLTCGTTKEILKTSAPPMRPRRSTPTLQPSI